MNARKNDRRKPDLAIDVDHFVEFTDMPKGGATGSPNKNVVFSYDPVVEVMAEKLSQKKALPKKKGRLATSAHPKTQQPFAKEDLQRIRSLETMLDDCLQSAKSIKGNRAADVILLLSDARTKIAKLYA